MGCKSVRKAVKQLVETADELMGLDRLSLRHKVAFELSGPQHYHATECYDRETVNRQRKRDEIRRGICAARGIELVIIHPEDLSVAGILAKVQDLKDPLPPAGE